MKVYILRGLPASGKTTWAKEKLKEGNWKRVNKDDLRAMIDDGKWSGKNEKFILKLRDTIILEALGSKYNVIVDDTNFEEKHVERIKKIVNVLSIDVKVQVKDFKVELDECIKRDLVRPNSVGEKVIKGMYNKYIKEPNEVYKFTSKLPLAIVVDIDGTLAKMKNRSPFDWDKVDEDLPNEPIIDIVQKYKDFCRIIVVSGRDAICKGMTEEWLKDNNIPYDELHMRPEGNNENDGIIKRRIFDEKIRKFHNILFALDDRDQAVKMWRQAGVTCLQVEYGDF